MGIKGLQDRMKPSVYGVGYLGGNLELKSTYNGKKCNIYMQWKNMIERCYNEKFHQRQPTYVGCTVSDEFKDYSKWREWYDKYPYKQDDWQIDKESYIKELADKYKDILDPIAYEALYNYTVDIDD